jgi:hypothetical protein
MAASFAMAAYQDVRDRAVSDLVWIPAVAGAAYSIYWAFPNPEFPIAKLALVAVVALVFTMLGLVGQADAIALVVISADPYNLSPIFPLVAAAAVMATHIAYEFLVGNTRGTKTIPMEKFLREQRWIPKAILSDGARREVSKDVNKARDEVEASNEQGALVEVTYGVPTVAYLGAGYVVYLVCMLLFSPAVFLSLP